ncbi:MAG: HAD-IC family P-type ATPase, partial [Deltaproteobacteria bacterium]
GAFRLGKHGVLVRKLASVETLGATTVICTDKTGTLTLGRFDLAEHVAVGGQPGDDELLEIAALACEPHPSDPMERAIAAHCVEHATAVESIHGAWELVRDHPFDPVGKHMSHVWRRRDDPTRWRVVAKGALEGILEHCAADAAARARIEQAHAEMATRGLRLLGVAFREYTGDATAHGRANDERDLHFVGFVGFRDPLRPEVPDAVRDCLAAGIRIKIVTGDHALTAHAIASAAGIPIGPHGVITGDEIDALPEPERERRAREATVFARVRPEQKYAIVDALCRAGEIVAMTGDGVNDAPALRRADIGVAMGKRGTDVARGAADLTLLEDDFASIVSTVREGRRIFANIQRAFLYLIAFHIPIVTLALLMPLTGRPLFLLPVHLVWLELIVHPVSALVFEGEEPPVDVMRQPPRSPRAPLLAPRRVMRSAVTGCLLSAAVFAAYAWHLPSGEATARSVALVTLIAGCVLLSFAEREGDRGWFRAGQKLGARFAWVNLAVLGSLPLVINVPPVARVFHAAPIGPAYWLESIGLATLAVGWRAFGSRRRTSPQADAHSSWPT